MAIKTAEKGDEGGVVIEGLASTPDIDRYRDIVEPEAFKDALEMYMKNPVILRSHDPDRPIGTVTSAIVTDKGLKITALIKDEKTGGEILDGRMRALSIGYIPLSTELQHEDGSAFNFEEDSVFDADLVRVIKALDLIEISVVSTPANGNALFTIGKSIKAAMNDMVCASFNIKKAMDIKKKEVEEVVAEEEVQAEVVEEAVTEATEEPAVEDTTEESKEAPEAEAPEAEEAGNAGETPAADDAEGEPEAPAEEVAEEAEADVEPQEGAEAEEAPEEKTALVLSAKDASAMTILKRVGAVRAAAEGEETETLSPEAKAVIEIADKALALAEKAITDLEAKLDAYAEKKPLAGHEQLDHEAVEAKTTNPNQVSKGFAQLFGVNG